MAEGAAVLLIAHGSRRASANEDLARLAERIAERGHYPIVETAYLELAEPTIEQGARTCVARGAGRVLMFPYFLSAGVHVVNDLEQHRARLAAAFPDVTFTLCSPLGLHPLLVEIVLERLRDAEGKDKH